MVQRTTFPCILHSAFPGLPSRHTVSLALFECPTVKCSGLVLQCVPFISLKVFGRSIENYPTTLCLSRSRLSSCLAVLVSSRLVSFLCHLVSLSPHLSCLVSFHFVVVSFVSSLLAVASSHFAVRSSRLVLFRCFFVRLAVV